MLSKEKDIDHNNQNQLQELEKFEKAAAILANLALENIFLSSKTLKRMLEEKFDLSPSTIDQLTKIFAKNNNGGDPNKPTNP